VIEITVQSASDPPPGATLSRSLAAGAAPTRSRRPWSVSTDSHPASPGSKTPSAPFRTPPSSHRHPTEPQPAVSTLRGAGGNRQIGVRRKKNTMARTSESLGELGGNPARWSCWKRHNRRGWWPTLVPTGHQAPPALRTGGCDARSPVARVQPDHDGGQVGSGCDPMRSHQATANISE
jgi:hypothetical protein